MSKKSCGLCSLLTGFAAGAAAVFFSKKENRQKAKAVAKKAVSKAKKVAKKAKAKTKKK